MLKAAHQSRISVILIALGIILGAVAAGLLVHDHRSQPKPPPGAIQAAAKSSVKPTQSQIANYQAPPDVPKYIAMPAIKVQNSRVIQLGLTKNNQIAIPNNIYDAGWYNGSAKPGQAGATFIFGHVSSWQANGIFYNLKKLKAGDRITITRGDDKIYTYQVVSTKTYSYNNVDMNQVLAPIDAAKPGLNLMTCAGQIIKGSSEFSQRLVVFTSLVSAERS